ncbi:hypothetical protein BDV18DRAFT_160436 [Aspergillus unguis]
MSLLQFPEHLNVVPELPKSAAETETALEDDEIRPLLSLSRSHSPAQFSDTATTTTSSHAHGYSRLDDGEVDLEAAFSTSEPLPKLNVMVAEENPFIAAAIRKRLELLGHNVNVLHDGNECVDVHHEELSSELDGAEPFDLIFMSVTVWKVDMSVQERGLPKVANVFCYQLRGITGCMAVRMIRETEYQEYVARYKPYRGIVRRIPIIVLTEGETEKKREYYIECGFDGWLVKPLDYDRMTALVDSVLDDGLRRQNVYIPGIPWTEGGWFL